MSGSASPVPIALLAGPQILGVFLNWSLQGVLTIQTYVYYQLFSKDPAPLRYLVYGMLVYEWVQTGLVTQVAFENFVFSYGDISALTGFHNTWFSVTIMCALTAGVVQCYFGYRTWVLARSVVVTSVIITFAIIQICLGIAGGIMFHIIKPSAAESSAVTPVIAAWLATAAFVDIIIAVSMTWLLWRAKSGIKASDDMIKRLICLVVETGTLTATIAIVDVVCFSAFSRTLLHECPAVVLAKLYSNTFLASLNNRYILRSISADGAGFRFEVEDSSSTSSFPMRLFKPAIRAVIRGTDQQTVMSQGHITVQQETFVTRDLEVFPDGAKHGI